MLNAAVLGSPITHSLSPVLHRAGYAALGLREWRYTSAEVDEGAFPGFVAALDSTWRGLSLTTPLKEVAFRLAAEVDETARVTGTVNTYVRRGDGTWAGYNTDVLGLERALGPAPKGAEATVLGSGATARSAVVALGRAGATRVRVAARREAAARAVAALATSMAGHEVATEVVALERWAPREGEVVVSALPPGAEGSFVRTLGGSHRGTLLDVVYADWPTPIARAAEAAGMRVIGGLDMLVHQAGAQFELFTGVPEAPLATMFAAGRAALEQRSLST